MVFSIAQCPFAFAPRQFEILLTQICCDWAVDLRERAFDMRVRGTKPDYSLKSGEAGLNIRSLSAGCNEPCVELRHLNIVQRPAVGRYNVVLLLERFNGALRAVGLFM